MHPLKQPLSLPTFLPGSPASATQYTHIYREGGFRLEQQNMGDKHIFHNYGQGDAQLSLSYGSAYICSKIITVRQDATKIKEVAVIGGGVNAMMTALELVKRGYKVILYAPRLPVKREGNTKIVAAQEGAQFWYPGGYDNCDPLKHELIAKLSFQFFKECLLANRYQSLRQATCYISPSRNDDLRQQVTEYINNGIKLIMVMFANEKMEEYIGYKTILVDTRLFIEEIFTELKLRNVSIVETQFKSIADVMGLKQKCIFNCLGQEIVPVFGDPAVQVTRGCCYTVSSETKSSPQNLSLWIGSELENQEDVVISIFNNKLQIGSKGTGISSRTEKQAEERVLARAYHFMKERTIKTYKL